MPYCTCYLLSMCYVADQLWMSMSFQCRSSLFLKVLTDVASINLFHLFNYCCCPSVYTLQTCCYLSSDVVTMLVCITLDVVGHTLYKYSQSLPYQCLYNVC